VTAVGFLREVAVLSAHAAPALFSRLLRKGWGLSARLNLHTSLPILAGMAKKPETPQLSIWDIFKIAKKSVWLGSVEASDKAAAIEKGAQEFKTEAWRLYAVQRR
jgi:hypothetical protein